MEPLRLYKLSFFAAIAYLAISPAFCQLPPTWHSDPFHHIETLDTRRGNYILEWAVNWTNRTILFNVTAKTTGWVGFGLTAKGRMFGADLVMGGVQNSRPYLYDMHVPVGTRRLPIRDNSQDYRLHSAWENKTHTSLLFSREFETCDDQDRTITDDTFKLIWAMGENDDITQYHYEKRGSFETYLLDPDFSPREIKEAKRTGKELTSSDLGEFSVWTVNRKMKVPSTDTTYWCSIHKGPQLSKKHHILGFDYRWQTREEFNHVHHHILFKCKAPTGVDPVEFFEPYVRNNTGESCYFLLRGEVGDLPTQYCREFIYTYAIGANMFFLPNHTGVPIGLERNEYYLLQVHYDNPGRRSDLEFDVNIDLYHTPNLRENDLGVLALGHHIPGSPSLLVPPNSLGHNIYGHCGSDCTKEMIPKAGINVVGGFHHTHNSGVRHRLSHFRGRRELPWILNDGNYENLYQPTRMLREEVKILPGDHLMVSCAYDNTWWAGNAVVGGFSTRQEMCTSFIWYYNKIGDYSLCRNEIISAEYNWKHLGVRNMTWSDPHLEYVVTEPESLRGLTIGQVATDKIDWTRKRREELERDQRDWVHNNYCNRIGEEPTIGVGEAKMVEYPKNVMEYKRRDEKDKKCRARKS